MIRVTVMNSNYIQSATSFQWAALDPDVSADCVANCVGESSGERTVSVLVQNLATVGEAGSGLLVGIDNVDYRGRMVKVALAPGILKITCGLTMVVSHNTAWHGYGMSVGRGEL